jgi:hypothetical protein
MITVAPKRYNTSSGPVHRRTFVVSLVTEHTYTDSGEVENV